MLKLYSYNTFNLGDDIQTLAVMQHGVCDGFIERDLIGYHTEKSPVRMILFGWHMNDILCWLRTQYRFQLLTRATRLLARLVPRRFRHYLYAWPPSADIEPLLISMHCTKAFQEAMSPASIAYFKKHQPVGCRDLLTQDFFEKNGVEAYFSGCLTLTLKKENFAAPRFSPNEKPRIYLVDIPGCETKEDTLFKSLPACIREYAEFLTHATKLTDLKQRHDAARQLLARYTDADLVITSRLHCALPCVAFGTPVLFFHGNLADSRFAGLLDHVHHHPMDAFTQVLHGFDLSNIPANPPRPEALIQRLEHSCRAFASA
mgnify:CR=1 FL=1